MDSRADIAEALNDTLVSERRDPLPVETILPMIGDGARALVARAITAGAGGGRADGTDERLVDRVSAAFQQRYAARPCVHTTLLPGALEATAVGVPCAVVTNKPRAITLLVLGALGILDRFAAVWAGGDGPLKPAPDGVFATAARLGVPVDQAWVIGDGPQDVLAGHAAGCFTVAVPGIADREKVLAAKPDLVVASLFDVARLARAEDRVTSA